MKLRETTPSDNWKQGNCSCIQDIQCIRMHNIKTGVDTRRMGPDQIDTDTVNHVLQLLDRIISNKYRNLRDRLTMASSTTAAIQVAWDLWSDSEQSCTWVRWPLGGVILMQQHHQWHVSGVRHKECDHFSNRGFCWNGRVTAYQRLHEHFAPSGLWEVDRFHGGSVMMWAAISHTGRTDLV